MHFPREVIDVLFQPVTLLVDIVQLRVYSHYLLVLPLQLDHGSISHVLRLHQFFLDAVHGLLALVLFIQADRGVVLQRRLVVVQLFQFNLVVVFGVLQFQELFIALFLLLWSLFLLLFASSSTGKFLWRVVICNR